METRRGLVTGCAGFIGSHLSERLRAGGWDVVGVDAFRPYYAREEKEKNLAMLLDDPDFSLVELDVAEAALEPLFSDIDTVFHFAAQPGVRASFGDGRAQCLRDNVRASQRVFEAALRAGCRRVIWASSSSVYGDTAVHPCRETAPSSPCSPYGATKQWCEEIADVYAALGLETVGLRYFTVYGPRQRPDMAIRRLCHAALERQAFVLYGDGHQSRDFTYVHDAVEAAVRAADVPASARLYNVGGGHEASLREVIDVLERQTGGQIPIVPAAGQRGDVRRTSACTERAQRAFGWSPRFQLEEGLAATLAWVEARAPLALARSRRSGLDACV